MSKELNRAIVLAASAHSGQFDKAGMPYILHPLRVMLAMDTTPERIVAVLHDVAEDNADGWQDIHDAGFDQEIVSAIDSVTRRQGEDYFAYVERAGSNPIGRKVKVADLRDNLRGPPIPLHDRYRKALAMLSSASPDTAPL